MDEFTIVAIAVGVGVPLFLALIVTIIIWTGRRRPQSGLGPRYDATGVHPPIGRWNAQILADGFFGSMGGTLGAVEGQLAVEDGELRFYPADAQTPTWSFPCTEIGARPHTAMSTAGMTLLTPRGNLRCNVSRESLSIYSRNTFKTMREPGYAMELAHVLVANGARWS